jgi:hypothetical protein
MPPWPGVLGRPLSFGHDTALRPVSVADGDRRAGMSRTLQTQPRQILAARRAAAPRQSRGHEPLSLGRQRRLIGELGLGPPEASDDPHLPRIRVSRCRPGQVHPIGRGAIVGALTFFGPLVSYGLRSIELRQAGEVAVGSVALALLMVPGRIVLYEQPEPPWEVRGQFSTVSRHRLERAGAEVEPGPSMTRVVWPGDSLAGLMLFDGLMHEIGHHLIQHHTGKRTARLMRTADHERAAQRFADACRRAWANRAPGE